MSREVPIPNPPLSRKEATAFAKLSKRDKAAIDAGILSCVLPHWQKVAMVVGLAENKLTAQFPQFSYILYAKRIHLLAKQGQIESQGNLRHMRFSEVRLPVDEKIEKVKREREAERLAIAKAIAIEPGFRPLATVYNPASSAIVASVERHSSDAFERRLFFRHVSQRTYHPVPSPSPEIHYQDLITSPTLPVIYYLVYRVTKDERNGGFSGDWLSVDKFDLAQRLGKKRHHQKRHTTSVAIHSGLGLTVIRCVARRLDDFLFVRPGATRKGKSSLLGMQRRGGFPASSASVAVRGRMVLNA